MSFKWLPDAELDPHPRLTWLTECCFDLTVKTLYRKEEILPEGYRLAPGTLVVSNHQRDSDVPVLTTVLCRREGLNIRFPLPFYATREDIFHAGFLRDLLDEAGWPRPVARLMGRVPLRWLFRIVRARPIRRVREFTFGEAVRLLVAEGHGAATPAEMLRPGTLHRLERELGRVPATLSALAGARLGTLRLEEWGLRRLQLHAVRLIEIPFRDTVATHLEEFRRLLDDGRVVYFAPEGTISEDGRMRRIRRGVWRLHRDTRDDVDIRPLALSYDPLGPGRLRVVIHVGEGFDADGCDDAHTFNSALRRSLLSLCAVTPSHLVSRYLHRGPESFSRDEFADWFAAAAEAVVASPLTADPLLARCELRELAHERLDWLRRRRLVERARYTWRNGRDRDTGPGWHSPEGVVTYLDAALADLLSLEPALDAELRP